MVKDALVLPYALACLALVAVCEVEGLAKGLMLLFPGEFEDGRASWCSKYREPLAQRFSGTPLARTCKARPWGSRAYAVTALVQEPDPPFWEFTEPVF